MYAMLIKSKTNPGYPAHPNFAHFGGQANFEGISKQGTAHEIHMQFNVGPNDGIRWYI